eukprot:9480058-Pyramimonas_sp.AAC.1
MAPKSKPSEFVGLSDSLLPLLETCSLVPYREDTEHSKNRGGRRVQEEKRRQGGGVGGSRDRKGREDGRNDRI